jgi:hypothetical protein
MGNALRHYPFISFSLMVLGTFGILGLATWLAIGR